MRLCRRKRKWIGGTNLAVLKAKPINLIILQLLSKNSFGVRRQSSKETEAKNSAYVVAFMTTENVFNVAALAAYIRVALYSKSGQNGLPIVLVVPLGTLRYDKKN